MGSPNGHGPSREASSPAGEPRSDLASISLIVGIVSIPAVFLGIIGGTIAGIAAVVVGRRALARKRGANDEGRGVAVAGIVTGVVGIVVSLVAAAFYFFAM